jgi:hypothetical protein
MIGGRVVKWWDSTCEHIGRRWVPARRKKVSALAVAVALRVLSNPAVAQDRVFDLHVHLYDSTLQPGGSVAEDAVRVRAQRGDELPVLECAGPCSHHEDFFMDNIYFDISGTVVLAADSPIEEEFVWTILNVGVDRILLGSDYPQWSLAKNA